MMGKENGEAWPMAQSQRCRQRCPASPLHARHLETGGEAAAGAHVSARTHTHTCTPRAMLRDTHPGPQAVLLRNEVQEVPRPRNMGPRPVWKTQPGLQLVGVTEVSP